MVAGTLKSDPNRSRRAVSRALGYDFALLGLPAREARVQVIRDAARLTAALIHEAAIDEHDQQVMLSDLAASTYRLLDPRRRARMLERIQLSIFSEEDLQAQQGSRESIISRKDSLVPAVVVEAQDASAPASPSVEVATQKANWSLRVEAEVKNSRRSSGGRFGRLTLSVIAALCAGAMTLTILSLV